MHSSLPPEVERAERLTKGLCLLVIAQGWTGRFLFEMFRFQLDRYDVWMPIFGREAETFDEYVEWPLCLGNVERTGAGFQLTPQGSRCLGNFQPEAS